MEATSTAAPLHSGRPGAGSSKTSYGTGSPLGVRPLGAPANKTGGTLGMGAGAGASAGGSRQAMPQTCSRPGTPGPGPTAAAASNPFLTTPAMAVGGHGQSMRALQDPFASLGAQGPGAQPQPPSAGAADPALAAFVGLQLGSGPVADNPFLSPADPFDALAARSRRAAAAPAPQRLQQAQPGGYPGSSLI